MNLTPRRGARLTILLGLTLLSGCADTTITEPVPSSSPTPVQADAFLFARSADSRIRAFRIFYVDGRAQPVAGEPFECPGTLAPDPLGRFLFCWTNDSVRAFTVSAPTGALTLSSTTPLSVRWYDGLSFAIHPSGRYGYFTSDLKTHEGADPFSCWTSAEIRTFSIDTASGALSPVVGGVFKGGVGRSLLRFYSSGGWAVAVSRGEDSIACNGYNIGGSLRTFRVRQGTGALETRAPVAFAQHQPNLDVGIDPVGVLAFVAQSGYRASTRVLAIRLDESTGALIQTDSRGLGTMDDEGSDATIGSLSVRASSSGGFVYASGQTWSGESVPTLWGWRYDSSGRMSEIDGLPCQSVNGRLVLRPDGRFFYRAKPDEVEILEIDAETGQLTPRPAMRLAVPGLSNLVFIGQ